MSKKDKKSKKSFWGIVKDEIIGDIKTWFLKIALIMLLVIIGYFVYEFSQGKDIVTVWNNFLNFLT